ncbi:MAG: aminopeptidase N [Alphaproteobacteria bacterium]|nr:aminopeptidase N [Alphaproteobacteria bacterium]
MTFYRKDYQRPTYQLPITELDFILDKTKTIVKAKLHFTNYPVGEPLVLNGVDLKLIDINMPYKKDGENLILHPESEDFIVKSTVEINPEANTQLMGLYIANGLFTTQNEPEGFRHITYYPDRPDVMSKYRITIHADKALYPVRLSNGNIISETDDTIVFEDPFAKPCYLFALVAGSLDVLTDTFTTKSGKNVALSLYCEPGKKDRLKWAMQSIKKAMKWDEDVFGLEYDLDRFSIVAVSHFNAGAMENKSLNIFNDSCLLASQMTATDDRFAYVEVVVAHEYFHNYSGDRVTLENWFNLSLKEGFTVFRETEFTYDVHSHALERMKTVADLRTSQFSEDDGPLAHPILLDQAEDVNNFYTSTIYDKGAEVIRMMKAVVGPDKFMEGCRLYFTRYDGQAVSIEEFIRSIEDASNMDLTQFRQWYHVPKRPHVKVQTSYQNNIFIVKLTQTHSLTDKPFVIPLVYGLVGANGKDLASGTFILDTIEQEYHFDVAEKPVLSINRDFSAIVDIDIIYTAPERLHLMTHDSDLFNRLEIGQNYIKETLANMIKNSIKVPDTDVIQALGTYLDSNLDPAVIAMGITFPAISEILPHVKGTALETIYATRKLMQQAFADTYQDKLLAIYEKMQINTPYSVNAEQVSKRALKNAVLSYLAMTKHKDIVYRQYQTADNFTDLQAALRILVFNNLTEAQTALDDFYNRYKDDELPLNSWFQIQAARPDILAIETARNLIKHPKFEFTNPNKVRAVLSVLGNNLIAFHSEPGYHFMAEQIIALDALNPHMAARLAQVFKQYKFMDDFRVAHATQALKHMLEAPRLSPGTKEIISKILA